MIAIAGHVLNEVVLTQQGSFGPVLGGPAAYASLAVRASGGACRLVSFSSEEDLRTLLLPLRELGVDLSAVTLHPNTRHSTLRYDADGRKTIEYGAVPPNIELERIFDTSETIEACLMCPVDFEVSVSTASAAARQVPLTMVDLGGYGGVVSSRHPIEDPDCEGLVEELIASVQVVKASDEDLEWITGSVDPVANAERLVSLGANIALVTRGKHGAIVKVSGLPAQSVQIPDVKAVDTTGAGDAFCGAFLVEFLRNEDPMKAAAFASAFASFVVESSGGAVPERFPSVGDVERRATEAVRQEC